MLAKHPRDTFHVKRATFYLLASCFFRVLLCLSMRSNTVIVADDQRDYLKTFMGKHGIKRAAELLEMPRVTLERAAFGLAVQRGTAALVAHKIAERGSSIQKS